MSNDNSYSKYGGLISVPGNLKWEFERDRCALLVVDMQNDFVAEGGVMQVKEAGRQIPVIKKLIEKCRIFGVPVIYTLQRTTAALSPLEVAHRPMLKEKGIREGTWGTEIVSDIAPQPDDLLVWKRRPSAFYQTDLELTLRNVKGSEKPVDTVIICGTVTNICCESTARDAYFRDFKVVFGSDITSAHFEHAHNATLHNMEFFGRVLDSEAIIAALEQGKG